MTSIISVQTGEVAMCPANGNILLESSPLGSCIAAIMVDAKQGIAGMAHIMLPGRSSEEVGRNRYTENAIDELLTKMLQYGAHPQNLQIFAIGAANVLKRSDDIICQNNIISLSKYLEKLAIPLIKTDLGGEERRVVSVDCVKREIRCSTAGKEEELFFRY